MIRSPTWSLLSAGALAVAACTESNAPAAVKLAFTVDPSNSVAGTAIRPVISVAIQDANGRTVTNATDVVTLAIGANPSAATLSGTASAAAVRGIATFSTLSLSKTGLGYTLRASASGLMGATSGRFYVVGGPAARLVFTTQPIHTITRDQIPSVRVIALDAFGNTATEFGGDVTVAIGTNPTHGSLAGTATVGAMSGLATFASLSIDSVGMGYTLIASAPGIAGVTSAAFNIIPPNGRLVFTVQPGNTAAGVAISPSVTVAVQDLSGNALPTATDLVTVTIDSNPGGGTLAGATSAAAVNGIASFSTLRINNLGTGYRLRARATGLISARSDRFDIVQGPPTQLAFTVGPTATYPGLEITPAVQVAARDALGNIVVAFTDAVTVAIGTNPRGGTLAGTLTVNAVSGIATFSGLSIDSAGAGYTLTASSGALPIATSAPFTIAAITTGLRITTTTTGASLPSGYDLCIDPDYYYGCAQSYPVGVNAMLTVPLPAGTHVVQLDNVPPNCTVAGDNPRSVTVSGVTDVQFAITCAATGSVRVTTATTGIDPDPDGYQVCVDFGGSTCHWSGNVAASGVLTISGVTVGAHTVNLTGVAVNCTVAGGASHVVTVAADGVVDVTFDIGCVLAERLAFNAGGTIAVIRIDGSGYHSIRGGAAPAWSPSAERLAFECGPNICAINPDGTGFASLTIDGASNKHPSWSPDGSKIAFAATHGGAQNLWVMASDGSGALQLTQNVGFTGSPAWSPTGATIVFDCEVSLNNFDLCAVNADGTGFARLTTDPGSDYGAAWKPDGSALAFTTTRYGEQDIVLMSPTGGSVSPIGLPGYHPTWSPDGTKLAFVQTYSDYYYNYERIVVAPVDGSSVSIVTYGGNQPAWEPHP